MLKIIAAAILLAAVAIPSILFATQGNTGTEARVAAYKHEDGRTEFAIQVKEGDRWGERLQPSARYLPADVPEGRWLVSSSVDLPGGAFEPVQTDIPLWHTELDAGEVGYNSWHPEPLGPFTTNTIIRAETVVSDYEFRAIFRVSCYGRNRSAWQPSEYGQQYGRATVEFYMSDFPTDALTPYTIDTSHIDAPFNPNHSTFLPQETYIVLIGTKQENGETVEKEWWVNTLSVDWLFNELREYDELYVGMLGYPKVEDRNGYLADASGTAVFRAWFPNFKDLFDTPVQENIDRCGTY